MMMATLRETARKLKANKINTKWLITELMKISSVDFTVDHANYKLYKYGFSYCGNTFKCMMELCESGHLIFNGYKPEKVNNLIVGFVPVFGLIR